MSLNEHVLSFFVGSLGGYFCALMMYWLFIKDHKKQFMSWVAYSAENKAVLKIAKLEEDIKQLKLDVLELMQK